MSFKDQMKEDFKNRFLNTNEFAEVISYTPKDDVARSIKAVVTRNRLDPAEETPGRTLNTEAEISIANDATVGVASVNRGGDTVSFPDRLGGSNVSWVVADILDQDESSWRLLVTR
ncbi:MAG: hypothetical protein HZB36_02455 [Candidatus Omnitrophica bacterium]|nr:hypothetical protein [Candidatus Omnitrophota bacterium]